MVFKISRVIYNLDRPNFSQEYIYDAWYSFVQKSSAYSTHALWDIIDIWADIVLTLHTLLKKANDECPFFYCVGGVIEKKAICPLCQGASAQYETFTSFNFKQLPPGDVKLIREKFEAQGFEERVSQQERSKSPVHKNKWGFKNLFKSKKSKSKEIESSKTVVTIRDYLFYLNMMQSESVEEICPQCNQISQRETRVTFERAPCLLQVGFYMGDEDVNQDYSYKIELVYDISPFCREDAQLFDLQSVVIIEEGALGIISYAVYFRGDSASSGVSSFSPEKKSRNPTKSPDKQSRENPSKSEECKAKWYKASVFNVHQVSVEEVLAIQNPVMVFYQQRKAPTATSSSDSFEANFKSRLNLNLPLNAYQPLPSFYSEKRLLLGKEPGFAMDGILCEHDKLIPDYYDIYSKKTYKHLLYKGEKEALSNRKTLRLEREALKTKHNTVNKLLLGITYLPEPIVNHIMENEMVDSKYRADYKSFLHAWFEQRPCKLCLQYHKELRVRRIVEKYLFLTYHEEELQFSDRSISKRFANQWINFLFYDTKLIVDPLIMGNHHLPDLPTVDLFYLGIGLQAFKINSPIFFCLTMFYGEDSEIAHDDSFQSVKEIDKKLILATISKTITEQTVKKLEKINNKLIDKLYKKMEKEESNFNNWFENLQYVETDGDQASHIAKIKRLNSGNMSCQLAPLVSNNPSTRPRASSIIAGKLSKPPHLFGTSFESMRHNDHSIFRMEDKESEEARDKATLQEMGSWKDSPFSQGNKFFSFKPSKQLKLRPSQVSLGREGSVKRPNESLFRPRQPEEKEGGSSPGRYKEESSSSN